MVAWIEEVSDSTKRRNGFTKIWGSKWAKLGDCINMGRREKSGKSADRSLVWAIECCLCPAVSHCPAQYVCAQQPFIVAQGAVWKG